ncbi:UbiA prenyltransferase family protein [Robertkochia flava]|uniref:hypothetical protein n=1 Tax=Robertkochia flava TaxID=3447986 RepID=UPI001CD02E0A|nr:hypothetical protein [Robertkochia marina]
MNSSMHVALSVAVLCYVSGLYFQFVPPGYLVACLFFGSVVGYNFIKYAPLADNFISVKGAYLKNMQGFSALSFIAALYFLRFFTLPGLVCTAVIGMLVFFYVFPIHRLRGSIRNVRGLKVYVVALVWALATVVLPALEAGVDLNGQLVFETFRRGVFILAITIPFEIRDLNLDQPGLYTIPQQLGVRGAKLLGYCLLLGFWLMGVVFEVAPGGVNWEAEGVLVLMAAIMLYGASRSQHRYYSGLMVESLPLVWLGLLVLF